MSEDSARIYSRVRRNGISSSEAWEDVEGFAHELDWDLELILPDSTGDISIPDRETPE